MHLTFMVCNQNADGSIVCIGQHSWRLAARYDLWDLDDISVPLKGRSEHCFPVMSSAGKELVCDIDADTECHAPHAARRTPRTEECTPRASNRYPHPLRITHHLPLTPRSAHRRSQAWEHR